MRESDPKIKKITWHRSDHDRGYTLLFSVLVSALVLAIGISILSISKKEVLLTASARDSSAAFYAADGGLECAIYADRAGADVFKSDGSNINNLGANCIVSLVITNVAPPIFEFHARFGSLGTSCAIVTVDKTPDALGNSHTVITSKGYNTGWRTGNGDTPPPRCDAKSVKKVERAIRYSY